jgi:hypothetical protein
MYGTPMSDSDNASEKETTLKLYISSENRPRSLDRYIRDAWAVARVLEAWAAIDNPLDLREKIEEQEGENIIPTLNSGNENNSSP